jgi:hypothetical protein
MNYYPVIYIITLLLAFILIYAERHNIIDVIKDIKEMIKRV